LPPIVTVLSIDYSYAEFGEKPDSPVLTAIGNDGTGVAADATDAGLKQFKTDTVVYNRASAVAIDRESDGLATWERWVGNAAGNTALTFGENGGLHLVYGPPTPEMPKIGLWSYAFTGGTSPTFANAHPTTIATTGLTNVCVEMRVALVTVNSHVYDENVIIEPNTMRYASPSHERIVTCEKSNAVHSPNR